MAPSVAIATMASIGTSDAAFPSFAPVGGCEGILLEAVVASFAEVFPDFANLVCAFCLSFLSLRSLNGLSVPSGLLRGGLLEA